MTSASFTLSGVSMTSYGASDIGQMMPFSSWLVSISDGDDAVHADAVAAHDDGLLLFVGVEKAGFQGVGIFRAQLEHVADFDRVLQLQLAVSQRGQGSPPPALPQVGESVSAIWKSRPRFTPT